MGTDEETAALAAVSIIGRFLDGPGGVTAWRMLTGQSLEKCWSSLSPSLRAKFGLEDCKSLVVAALAYGEGPAEAPVWARGYAGPALALARFARADWYGELSSRLWAAGRAARAGLLERGLDPGPKGQWRHLANSGLPEKRLALAAGLGRLGRNGLVLVGSDERGHAAGIGPGVVLGLLLLPLDLAGAAKSGLDFSADRGGEACLACRACVDACPTGALGPKGRPQAAPASFARELCLQHWSALPGALPPAIEAAWGRRLYGCDSCLEACPFFRPDPAARTEKGLLGPGLPADWILAASEAELRSRLKGTTLGRAWMSLDAWRRNAGLALRGGGTFDETRGKL
jgi:epoxyqueuosine reductase